MHFGARSLEAAGTVSLSLSSASDVSFDISALGEVMHPYIIETTSVETLALGVGAFHRSGDNSWISQCPTG